MEIVVEESRGFSVSPSGLLTSGRQKDGRGVREVSPLLLRCLGHPDEYDPRTEGLSGVLLPFSSLSLIPHTDEYTDNPLFSLFVDRFRSLIAPFFSLG